MGDKTHRYYKHTKFCQNLRGDPKFLVDLTWNDPYTSTYGIQTFYACSCSIIEVLGGLLSPSHELTT